MKLKLRPVHSSDSAQVSLLTIDGESFCHILEDAVREAPNKPVSEWKIFGKTAIPAGSYKISLSFSPRFQQILPILEAVPGFSGVRIHPGNRPENTEGCLLPGVWNGGDLVSNSRETFSKLVLRLDEAFKAGEEVEIQVVR